MPQYTRDLQGDLNLTTTHMYMHLEAGASVLAKQVLIDVMASRGLDRGIEGFGQGFTGIYRRYRLESLGIESFGTKWASGTLCS